MLNILFNLETCIAHAFFCFFLSLDMLVVTKIFPKFLKIKIRFCRILINWKKDFITHQLHKKSSYKIISSNLKIYITNIK